MTDIVYNLKKINNNKCLSLKVGARGNKKTKFLWHSKSK